MEIQTHKARIEFNVDVLVGELFVAIAFKDPSTKSEYCFAYRKEFWEKRMKQKRYRDDLSWLSTQNTKEPRYLGFSDAALEQYDSGIHFFDIDKAISVFDLIIEGKEENIYNIDQEMRGGFFFKDHDGNIRNRNVELFICLDNYYAKTTDEIVEAVKASGRYVDHRGESGSTADDRIALYITFDLSNEEILEMQDMRAYYLGGYQYVLEELVGMDQLEKPYEKYEGDGWY